MDDVNARTLEEQIFCRMENVKWHSPSIKLLLFYEVKKQAKLIAFERKKVDAGFLPLL